MDCIVFVYSTCYHCYLFGYMRTNVNRNIPAIVFIVINVGIILIQFIP